MISQTLIAIGLALSSGAPTTESHITKLVVVEQAVAEPVVPVTIQSYGDPAETSVVAAVAAGILSPVDLCAAGLGPCAPIVITPPSVTGVSCNATGFPVPCDTPAPVPPSPPTIIPFCQDGTPNGSGLPGPCPTG